MAKKTVLELARFRDEYYQETAFNLLVCIKTLNMFYQSNVFVDKSREKLIKTLLDTLEIWGKRYVRRNGISISRTKSKRVFYVKDNYCRVADSKLPKYSVSYDWWIDLDEVFGADNTDQLFSNQPIKKYIFKPIDYGNQNEILA